MQSVVHSQNERLFRCRSGTEVAVVLLLSCTCFRHWCWGHASQQQQYSSVASRVRCALLSKGKRSVCLGAGQVTGAAFVSFMSFFSHASDIAVGVMLHSSSSTRLRFACLSVVASRACLLVVQDVFVKARLVSAVCAACCWVEAVCPRKKRKDSQNSVRF